MQRIIERFQNWRKPKPVQPAVAVVPYQIECECGKTKSGRRLPKHQVISCDECGRALFVLPISPLPALESVSSLSGGYRLADRVRKVWLLPLLVGVVTFAAVVAFLIIYAPFAGKPADSNKNSDAKIDHEKKLAEAQQYLQQGQFRLSANLFDAVLPKLSQSKRAQWSSQAKQAKLLADLLSEPLESVVQHAVDVRQDEWEADFPHRYAGKSVVFDLTLQRTETGDYRYTYEWPTANGEVRLAFESVAMLKRLSLDEPRRVIFGARLKSIRLEEPGPAWVIRFQPDSGVLITNHDAIIRCCPGLNDEASKSLLKRQKEWASE